MKTLVKKDKEIAYHPEFGDYGIIELWMIEPSLLPDAPQGSFSIVKEIVPYKLNKFQKFIIGFKQFKLALSFWKEGKTLPYHKFWTIL